MLTMTIIIDECPGDVIGLKEAIAAHLEQFGHIKIVHVHTTEERPEQLTIKL